MKRPEGQFGDVGVTAASASNSQEIDVYVALAKGAFRFDARGHALVRVTDADVRPLAFGPHQPPLSPDAPVQLVFVVDLGRFEHTRGFEEPGLHGPEVQKSCYYVDAGIIAGNVYLFAASEHSRAGSTTATAMGSRTPSAWGRATASSSRRRSGTPRTSA